MQKKIDGNITATAIVHTLLSVVGFIFTIYCLLVLKSLLLVCMGIITTLFNAITVFKEMRKR